MNQITTVKDNKRDFILYASEDNSLLRLAQTEYVKENSAEEMIRYEQGSFDVSEIIGDLGIISFLSSKRVVIINITEVKKFTDEDFDLLFESIELCESCRVAVFMLFQDKYVAESKRVKQTISLFNEIGSYKFIANLTGERIKKKINADIKMLNCTIDPDAVDLMVNKFSNDIFLLNNELQKVAAVSGYKNITTKNVDEISTTILSTDIFLMISALVSGNQGQCFSRLSILLEQGQEPIAILAAITGSFVDIYRVKLASNYGKRYGTVFKDFGYNGSDYRLKKANEIAGKINIKAIKAIMGLLLNADLKLKSTAAQREIILYSYLIKIGRLTRKR